MQNIDFSCRHDILLEARDGSLQPMDEPYFQAQQIAPETWQILSDGDFSYLLAGDDEALVIDSGYGAGNIRAFCQHLTDKPVHRIANTHDHFDHTANNAYFEAAYMAAETQPLATRPFPSFAGIDFPRDYPIILVDDGDIIPMKGRELLVLKIPDHAVGSLAFLDKKAHILFTGDEFSPMGKNLNGSVERWVRYLEKLESHRAEFDRMCGGPAIFDAALVEHNLENARYIMAGHEGVQGEPLPFPNLEKRAPDGRRIWMRQLPHPGDGPTNLPDNRAFLRRMDYAGCSITYDLRRVHETADEKR